MLGEVGFFGRRTVAYFYGFLSLSVLLGCLFVFMFFLVLSMCCLLVCPGEKNLLLRFKRSATTLDYSCSSPTGCGRYSYMVHGLFTLSWNGCMYDRGWNSRLQTFYSIQSSHLSASYLTRLTMLCHLICISKPNNPKRHSWIWCTFGWIPGSSNRFRCRRIRSSKVPWHWHRTW